MLPRNFMGWKQRISALLLPYIATGAIAASACRDENGGEVLNHTVAKTNAAGEAAIDDLSFSIKDTGSKPLEDITIHVLSNNDHYLALVQDEQEKYLPQLGEGSLPSSQYRGNLQRQGLSQTITFLLSAAVIGKRIYTLLRSSQGEFLYAEENVNHYCMTLEQMKHNYIDIPAGVLLLSLPSEEEEEIKITHATPIKDIFEGFIVTQYGQHDGYEVVVPKTALSLCEEQYEEILCPIDTETLSRKLWSHAGVPVWRIAGACNPGEQQNDAGASNNQPYGDGRYPTNVGETVQQCNLPSCVQYEVTRCEEPCIYLQSGRRCIPSCQDDTDCQFPGFFMRCYDLAPFSRPYQKGCFIVPCDRAPFTCPENYQCLDLTEQTVSSTQSGAEPLGATLSYQSCYNPECL